MLNHLFFYLKYLWQFQAKSFLKRGLNSILINDVYACAMQIAAKYVAMLPLIVMIKLYVVFNSRMLGFVLSFRMFRSFQAIFTSINIMNRPRDPGSLFYTFVKSLFQINNRCLVSNPGNEFDPEVFVVEEGESRFKRSAELDSVEEVAPLEEFGNNQTLPNTQRTLPAPFSTLQPRTLPRKISPPSPSKTLPLVRRVSTSPKTLPNAGRPSSPRQTFPNNVLVASPSPKTLPPRVRMTTTRKTFPTRRPFLLPRKTLPPPRPRPTYRAPNRLPSPRPRLGSIPRRTLPPPFYRFRPRPDRPTPSTNLPRPLSSRRPLPSRLRNPLSNNGRSKLPEPSSRPTKVLPTPSRFVFGGRPRVLPTPPSRKLNFIYIRESSRFRNYEGTVVGCPTVKGEFSVTSMNNDRFYGVVRFPPLKQPLTNGWLINMKFNVPLKDVSCNVLSKGKCSSNSREFCFVPNNPSTVIERNNVSTSTNIIPYRFFICTNYFYTNQLYLIEMKEKLE